MISAVCAFIQELASRSRTCGAGFLKPKTLNLDFGLPDKGLEGRRFSASGL